MKSDRCGFSGVVSSLSVDATHAVRGASSQRAGGVLWLTGLSGAGKTTLADALAARLRECCVHPVVLDGDRLRAGLNRDLGFTVHDRFENVRRIAEVAALSSESGALAIVSVISPLAAMRDEARSIVGQAFREVYVSTPLACCEARDPKGLYAKARCGALPEFTGVSSPYEPPVKADLTIDTGRASLAACVDTLMRFAHAQFGFPADARAAFDSEAGDGCRALRCDPEQQRGMAHAAESRPQVTRTMAAELPMPGRRRAGRRAGPRAGRSCAGSRRAGRESGTVGAADVRRERLRGARQHDAAADRDREGRVPVRRAGPDARRRERGTRRVAEGVPGARLSIGRRRAAAAAGEERRDPAAGDRGEGRSPAHRRREIQLAAEHPRCGARAGRRPGARFQPGAAAAHRPEPLGGPAGNPGTQAGRAAADGRRRPEGRRSQPAARHARTEQRQQPRHVDVAHEREPQLLESVAARSRDFRHLCDRAAASERRARLRILVSRADQGLALEFPRDGRALGQQRRVGRRHERARQGHDLRLHRDLRVAGDGDVCAFGQHRDRPQALRREREPGGPDVHGAADLCAGDVLVQRPAQPEELADVVLRVVDDEHPRPRQRLGRVGQQALQRDARFRVRQVRRQPHAALRERHAGQRARQRADLELAARVERAVRRGRDEQRARLYAGRKHGRQRRDRVARAAQPVAREVARRRGRQPPERVALPRILRRRASVAAESAAGADVALQPDERRRRHAAADHEVRERGFRGRLAVEGGRLYAAIQPAVRFLPSLVFPVGGDARRAARHRERMVAERLVVPEDDHDRRERKGRQSRRFGRPRATADPSAFGQLPVRRAGRQRRRYPLRRRRRQDAAELPHRAIRPGARRRAGLGRRAEDAGRRRGVDLDVLRQQEGAGRRQAGRDVRCRLHAGLSLQRCGGCAAEGCDRIRQQRAERVVPHGRGRHRRQGRAIRRQRVADAAGEPVAEPGRWRQLHVQRVGEAVGAGAEHGAVQPPRRRERAADRSRQRRAVRGSQRRVQQPGAGTHAGCCAGCSEPVDVSRRHGRRQEPDRLRERQAGRAGRGDAARAERHGDDRRGRDRRAGRPGCLRGRARRTALVEGRAPAGRTRCRRARAGLGIEARRVWRRREAVGFRLRLLRRDRAVGDRRRMGRDRDPARHGVRVVDRDVDEGALRRHRRQGEPVFRAALSRSGRATPGRSRACRRSERRRPPAPRGRQRPNGDHVRIDRGDPRVDGRDARARKPAAVEIDGAADDRNLGRPVPRAARHGGRRDDHVRGDRGGRRRQRERDRTGYRGRAARYRHGPVRRDSRAVRLQLPADPQQERDREHAGDHHAGSGRRQAVRRHQHHADARPRVRAADHLHHHDDRVGAGHQGRSAEGELVSESREAEDEGDHGRRFGAGLPRRIPGDDGRAREPAAHREGDQPGIPDRAEGRCGRAVPEGHGRARPAAPSRPVAERPRPLREAGCDRARARGAGRADLAFRGRYCGREARERAAGDDGDSAAAAPAAAETEAAAREGEGRGQDAGRAADDRAEAVRGAEAVGQPAEADDDECARAGRHRQLQHRRGRRLGDDRQRRGRQVRQCELPAIHGVRAAARDRTGQGRAGGWRCALRGQPEPVDGCIRANHEGDGRAVDRRREDRRGRDRGGRGARQGRRGAAARDRVSGARQAPGAQAGMTTHERMGCGAPQRRAARAPVARRRGGADARADVRVRRARAIARGAGGIGEGRADGERGDQPDQSARQARRADAAERERADQRGAHGSRAGEGRAWVRRAGGSRCRRGQPADAAGRRRGAVRAAARARPNPRPGEAGSDRAGEGRELGAAEHPQREQRDELRGDQPGRRIRHQPEHQHHAAADAEHHAEPQQPAALPRAARRDGDAVRRNDRRDPARERQRQRARVDDGHRRRRLREEEHLAEQGVLRVPADAVAEPDGRPLRQSVLQVGPGVLRRPDDGRARREPAPCAAVESRRHAVRHARRVPDPVHERELPVEQHRQGWQRHEMDVRRAVRCGLEDRCEEPAARRGRVLRLPEHARHAVVAVRAVSRCDKLQHGQRGTRVHAGRQHADRAAQHRAEPEPRAGDDTSAAALRARVQLPAARPEGAVGYGGGRPLQAAPGRRIRAQPRVQRQQGVRGGVAAGQQLRIDVGERDACRLSQRPERLPREGDDRRAGAAREGPVEFLDRVQVPAAGRGARRVQRSRLPSRRHQCARLRDRRRIRGRTRHVGVGPLPELEGSVRAAGIDRRAADRAQCSLLTGAANEHDLSHDARGRCGRRAAAGGRRRARAEHRGQAAQPVALDRAGAAPVAGQSGAIAKRQGGGREAARRRARATEGVAGAAGGGARQFGRRGGREARARAGACGPRAGCEVAGEIQVVLRGPARRTQCELYRVGHEILDAYEHVGIGTFFSSRQPFAQSARVKYDDLAQRYGDALYAGKHARPATERRRRTRGTRCADRGDQRRTSCRRAAPRGLPRDGRRAERHGATDEREPGHRFRGALRQPGHGARAARRRCTGCGASVYRLHAVVRAAGAGRIAGRTRRGLEPHQALCASREPRGVSRAGDGRRRRGRRVRALPALDDRAVGPVDPGIPAAPAQPARDGRAGSGGACGGRRTGGGSVRGSGYGCTRGRRAVMNTASGSAGRRSVGRRIAAALRALLPDGRPPDGRPGPTSAADAPVAWVMYAEGVAQALRAVLDGDEAAVCRLRADLGRWADRLADTGDDVPVLPVRAWLDRRGRVTRVDSAPASDPAVDAALRDALVGRVSARRRRTGMTQPIVMRVTLTGMR
ncbi:hypothetical protein Lal_00005360 [Lupinus albus]|nr:hypothetical protein Lal_00005360 [Lupinus albus]